MKIDFFEKYGIENKKIYSMSKHKLEDLKRDIQSLINSKYPRRKGRLLGTRSKAMPNETYYKLLNYFREDKKVQLAIKIMGTLGPRVGDVIKIKISDIDFKKHSIMIYNSKESRYYELPLEKKLEKDIANFISQNYHKIKENKDHIFFSEEISNKQRNHISSGWIRKCIGNALKDINCNKRYGKSTDGRDLWLYSSHSLRGRAGTCIYENTNNLRSVQRLLDHSPKSFSSTMLYIGNNEQDIEDYFRKED